MSDTVKSWIEERQAIHAAATEGPWEVEDHAPDESEYKSFGVGSGDVFVVFELPWDVDGEGKHDAEAIADAHNMFPRALDALNKVLELHRKERHQYGGWMCTQCTRNHPVPYPCATVQAIEGAIND